MEVKCLCMVVCSEVEHESGDTIKEFDHFEQCPLHLAALQMYRHAKVIVPYLMNMSVDAETSIHVLELKRLLEAVEHATRLQEERNKLSESEVPKTLSLYPSKNGMDGSGQN